MAGGTLILHGEIGGGKTRLAGEWARVQAEAGRRVGGVLALKSPRGRRFHDLWTGDETPKEPVADGEPAVEIGRFRFRRAAFDWAEARVRQAVASGAEAVVIDEVGPLEMRGEGFAALIDDVPEPVRLVLLVRTGLESAAAARFGRGEIAFEPHLD